MNVVGLDLSLSATGIAHENGDLSTFKTKPSEDMIDRLCRIRDHVMDCVDAADLTVIEGFAFGRPQGMADLGGLGWLIRVTLANNLRRFVVVPPASLKTFATGKGSAPKPDVRMEVFKRYGLDIRDDNQTDAFVLRAMGLYAVGEPIVALPATHTRALANVPALAELGILPGEGS